MKNTVRRIALLASLPVALFSTVLTGTPAQAALATPTAAENAITGYTNTARVRAGCPKVRVSYQLTYAARAHSVDMARRNYFSHTAANGSNFVLRARNAGYRSPMSENIARGYSSHAAMFDAWMKSPGHRANILNCSARAVGIGVAYNARGTRHYTQVFGRI